MLEGALDYPEDKAQLYVLLQTELRALVEGVPQPIPNLANASALLWQGLRNINWAGFYLMDDGQLVLGPFQGKPACIYIPVGKGVCGTAVEEGRALRVDNVHDFPGHIACDAASNSEIVIPIRDGERVVGVLDIDSPLLARFDSEDQDGLEGIVRILERACVWP
ncbi:MAG TPA: GAF domain-containing protein [Bacillota bacterium]|jgi:GAF domain-containing protein|nr:GAF domain-containing protein [Bacillota bacterium]